VDDIDIEHIIKDFSFNWTREVQDGHYRYMRGGFQGEDLPGYIDRDFQHRYRRVSEMSYNYDLHETNGAGIITTTSGDASGEDLEFYQDAMEAVRLRTTRTALVVVDCSGNYYVANRIGRGRKQVQTFVSCEVVNSTDKPVDSLMSKMEKQYDIAAIGRLRYLGILDLSLLKDKYYIYLIEYEQLPFDVQKQLKKVDLINLIDLELVMAFRMMISSQLDSSYLKEPAGFSIERKGNVQNVIRQSQLKVLTKLGRIKFHISSGVLKCIATESLLNSRVVKLIRFGEFNAIIRIQDECQNNYLGFYCGRCRAGEQFGLEEDLSLMYYLVRSTGLGQLSVYPGLKSEKRPYNDIFRTNWKDVVQQGDVHQCLADWSCDRETSKGDMEQDEYIKYQVEFCPPGSYGVKRIGIRDEEKVMTEYFLAHGLDEDGNPLEDSDEVHGLDDNGDDRDNWEW